MTKEQQKEIDIQRAINALKENLDGKGSGIVIIKIAYGQIADLEVTEKVHYGVDNK